MRYLRKNPKKSARIAFHDWVDHTHQYHGSKFQNTFEDHISPAEIARRQKHQRMYGLDEPTGPYFPDEDFSYLFARRAQRSKKKSRSRGLKR